MKWVEKTSPRSSWGQNGFIGFLKIWLSWQDWLWSIFYLLFGCWPPFNVKMEPVQGGVDMGFVRLQTRDGIPDIPVQRLFPEGPIGATPTVLSTSFGVCLISNFADHEWWGPWICHSCRFQERAPKTEPRGSLRILGAPQYFDWKAQRLCSASGECGSAAQKHSPAAQHAETTPGSVWNWTLIVPSNL